MPTVTETLNELSSESNVLLAEETQELESQLSGIDISILDMDILFSDILPAYLIEANESCVLGPPLAHAAAPTFICDNPKDFLFFDEVHPTTLVHYYLSQTAIQALGKKAKVGKFSHLVIFGDSLSDFGNVFGFSGGTFPPPVAPEPLAGEELYAPGAFTNGPLWWQYLIQNLNMPHPIAYYENAPAGVFPTEIPAEGINFAVGGAATGTDNTGNAQAEPFPTDLPGLNNQVSAFYSLLDEGEEADPNALYVIWAGSNNILGRFLPVDDDEEDPNPFGPFLDFEKTPAQIVFDITAAITRLYNRGARNFLVGNFYQLGNTPLGQELEDLPQEMIKTLPGAISVAPTFKPSKELVV